MTAQFGQQEEVERGNIQQQQLSAIPSIRPTPTNQSSKPRSTQPTIQPSPSDKHQTIHQAPFDIQLSTILHTFYQYQTIQLLQLLSGKHSTLSHCTTVEHRTFIKWMDGGFKDDIHCTRPDCQRHEVRRQSDCQVEVGARRAPRNLL